MNEVTTTTQQLPDTLEDLTQFVLVNKAKLQAYMLKLRTVEKLDIAQAIKDQTLKDSQEIASALLAAEQRIGELLLAIPKASGQYAESKNRPMSKNTLIKDMGYSKDEAADYQQMAKNPAIVEKVIKDAIASGEVPTKSEVTKNIRFQKQMEVIEHNASEPVKNAVRSGEISINNAYQQVMREKTPVTAKPKTEAFEAKQRHKEFEQKKSENIVNIQDAQRDKQDQQIIAQSLYKDILSLTAKSYWIGALNTVEDFERVANIIPDKNRTAEKIRAMVNVLEKLLEML